ncbi:hypothetical protein [Desulfoplanes formicivorans]|uniref:Lipoprotein n=1 Tax=Desulfoplanes formicivorans TaxID=1592317 RepID=A0A194AJW6_9BACT|nr:hypothetical protein [Desulfoplanes formicivorans]GAU09535.1 hypothetical protein DPF_2262 [Desulfoplanes formicivorans]
MKFACVSRPLGLAVALLFVALVVPGRAAQQVEVSWPLEPGQQEMDVRQQVLDAGFMKGVIQQADELLAQPMNEERAALFGTYMKDKVAELVQGYSVVRSTVHENPPSLDMVLSVTLNIPEIKKDLRRLGILYTCTQPVASTMTLSGVDAGDWQRLEELKTLTGVNAVVSGLQARADVADVRITKADTTAWQGELTAFNRTFSSSGKSLDEVWIALWQNYFSLDNVVARTFATVRFKIDGWYVPEGISYFDIRLSTWKKLVEQAHLVRLDLETESLGGVWEVRTRDTQAMRARLEQFVADKGLRLVSFDGGV